MERKHELWMYYIDREVRATCAAKGWSFQIRQKLSVREELCAESVPTDYGWEIFHCSAGPLPLEV
jgi:hypothetical protein